MKTKLITSIILIVALVAMFYGFNSYIYEEKQAYTAKEYKNAEYVIDGEHVKLVGDTKYFGNEVVSDLNSDGRDDIVFLITQDKGGSGTFYYVVAAINTEEGYIGSEGLLLGDRIAPQTTEKGKGNIVIVNYADRAPGEPMATKPSVGKSIWLILDPESMQFGEVEQNFEGEADPSRMSLDMKTWVWISTLYEDGREIKPKNTGKFTLTFNTGKFSATTDCNSIGGTYTVNNGSISFSEIFSTLMYCTESQETEFASMIENTQSYSFTSRGELILNLKFDSGSVVFK
jgi:META domain